MQGFFDIPQVKLATPKLPKGATGCDACLLYKKVQSPRIPPTGEGKLKTLIIGEAPGETEDKLNNSFVGETGHYLRKCLRVMGYDLDRDFWKTNTIICRSTNEKGSNRTPTSKEIKCCEPNWRAAIDKFKPKTILLFGAKAVEAFFMHRSQPITTNLSIGRWRKLCVPDIQTKAWVIPLYHPSFVIRNPDADSIFKLDLKWAMEQITSGLPEIEEIDYSKKVVCLHNVDEILNILKMIKEQKPTIAFDYETTGLRPYYPGHAIVSTAVAIYGEDIGYAWPYSYPGAWESGQLNAITTAWRGVLSDTDILKVAQNIQMEHPWSKIIVGEEPKGWCWDTMVCSHVIDERAGFTGLDFQTFLNWGYEYGGEISKYKKALPGSKFNSMMKCPLNQLLPYNGLDAYFTMRLAEKQWNFMDIGNKESAAASRAYDLFHNGTLTFSDMEMAGTPVNVEYYQDTQVKLEKRLVFLEKQLLRSPEAHLFKSKMNRDINLTSTDDLKKLFFDFMGIKSVKKTTGGGESVDKDVVESLDTPFAKELVKKRKLDKLKSTYIDGILELQVARKLHPNYNLHLVRTFRSSCCIAKGTMIEVVRDVSKYPLGIPIENVMAGDFVYCYDNDLKPAIRRVIWAGKTGNKKVVRIHWQAGQGGRKKGHLDVTPEHLIRTINGEYLEAQNLLNGDLRGSKQSKHSPKFRVLAVGRVEGDDRIYFTGCPPVLDHTLVYEQLLGELEKGDLVHHKDENHFNNIPVNLKKENNQSHAKIHWETNLTPEARMRGTETMKRLHLEGKIEYKFGPDNPNFKKISRFQLLKLLVKGKGTTAKREEFDFSTFKLHAQLEGIDLFVVKSRWDRNGKYISKNKLINILRQGTSIAIELLGFNYYKTKRLSEIYNINYQRKWGNQFGAFSPKNHIVTKIEHLNQFTEVYDIQVEEYPNFIANEICVHNSDPNLQNIPKRDKESMIMVRGGIIPSPGNVLLAADYGGHEVGIIACYSRDPVLMKERIDGADIHQEWSDFLQLKGFDAKTMRFDAKNAMVFALFYGSWYKNVHADLVSRGYTDLPLMRVQKAEQEFWRKYRGVKKFQEQLIKSYQNNGYVEMMHGFRRRGFLTKNEIVNTVVQGTAFHLLLWSCNKLNDLRKEEDWESKWIGEIHDEILGDIVPNELKHVVETTKRVMTQDILTDHPWICVPLISEVSVTDIDGPWHIKHEYKEN